MRQPWVCVKHDASGYNDEGICPSCEDPPPPWPPIAQPAYPTPRTSAEDVDVWLGLIDRSVAAEREACAELCDEIVDLAEEEHDVHLGHIAKVLGERIRARGKQ